MKKSLLSLAYEGCNITLTSRSLEPDEIFEIAAIMLAASKTSTLTIPAQIYPFEMLSDLADKFKERLTISVQ